MTAIAQAFSTALLHFVWQGLVVALSLWVMLFLLRNRSPQSRYAASCAALALMAVLPAATAAYLLISPVITHPAAAAVPLPPMATATANALSGGPLSTWAGWIERWALPVWCYGVLLFSLRLAWAAARLSTVRRSAQSPEAPLRDTIARLLDRVCKTRAVRVFVSSGADGPSVVGWVRPVILLPAATVAGLTPEQLEAVLAHEIAHILRYDYLVNMLQAAVETLLFYHPAVWWTSARIRQERELCCDDFAVETCGDRLCYARALTRLERMRVMTPGLALGSTGGSLVLRIRRIVGVESGEPVASRLPATLALMVALVFGALNMPWARGQQQQPQAAAPATAETSRPDEPGIRVNPEGATILQREPVDYPGSAIEHRIEGTVTLEVTTDATGSVSDARVLSGPTELRKAALESVLEWRFAPQNSVSTRQVSINFQLPADGGEAYLAKARAEREHKRQLENQLRAAKEAYEKAVQAGALSSETAAVAQKREAELNELAEARSAAQHSQALMSAAALDKQMRELQEQQALLQSSDVEQAAKAQAELAELQEKLRQSGSLPEQQVQGIQAQVADTEKKLAEMKLALGRLSLNGLAGRRLKSIWIDSPSLTDAARNELQTRLPVHIGDKLSADSLEKISAAAKQVDPNLRVMLFLGNDGQAELVIRAPDAGDIQ